MKSAAYFLFLAAALSSLPQSLAQQASDAREIVLIAGPMDDHPLGMHEYERTVLLLKHCLDRAANLSGFRTQAYFEGLPAPPQVLDRADTILITSAGADRGLDFHPLYSQGRLAQIQKQIERGSGLFLLHNSTVNPRLHHDLITDWLGGYFDFESGTGRSPYFSRVENKPWSMVLASPQHPIARGVGSITMREEVYSRMQFPASDPRRTSILLKQAEGSQDENTIAWAVERADGGRGFSFTGAHYYHHWWHPEFRKLVLNAIVWTSGAEVPEGGVRCDLEEPLKLLLVTGHNHPAHDWKAVTESLVHALSTDPRVHVEITENPEDLAADLSSYHSLVLNYSNWDRPGLSEAARQGFERYLAGGGGLSVIHFANGAFNRNIPDNAASDWELFRTEIVRRFWDAPRSGHDPYGAFRVQIQDRAHPVTSGLEDFETVDELYYRQGGDRPIQVLASARSTVTGRDEPMAWVYEYGRGRVFQTVLGHSKESIRRAATLIRRGAVWSAGGSPLNFDPPALLAVKEGLRKKPPPPRPSQ